MTRLTLLITLLLTSMACGLTVLAYLTLDAGDVLASTISLLATGVWFWVHRDITTGGF